MPSTQQPSGRKAATQERIVQAAMGLFARVMHDAFGLAVQDWSQIVALLSVASMFLGSVAASGGGCSQLGLRRHRGLRF